MAALTLVSRLGPDGWSWPVASVLLSIAVLMTIYFVRHERLAGNPIIPAEFLKDRAIGPSIICTFLFGICFLSLDTYVPLYVQGGRGGGATAAAGDVTPVMLTWALSGPISAPLIVRWGFRKLAAIGATLIVVGFIGLLVCAIFNLPQTLITAILAITGLGFGPSSMSYLLAAQEAVGWQQRGGVTGTVSFFRSIGGSLGVGLMGALFNVLIAPDMDRLRALGIKPAALLDPHEHAKLSPDALGQAQHMIARGLTWVFAAMVVVALMQAIVTTLMPAHRKPDHVPTSAEALEAAA
jgi:MFS family permease